MNQIWKTERIIRETSDAITIVFNTGNKAFSYKAGQFINLSVRVNEVTETRSYSLSSSPGDAFPSVTIKTIEGGLVSNHIHKYAESIKEWDVEGPQGQFHIDHDSVVAPHYVLIGGGSGITPLYSMANDVLRNTSAEIFIIYSSKNIESKIFFSRLQQLQSQYQERLHIQYILTSDHPQDTPLASPLLGRLNGLVLKKLLKRQLGEKIGDAHFFVCGPNGLIDLTEEALSSLQVDPANIHREYFHPPVVQPAAIKMPATTLEVLLHVSEQTNLIGVHPGASILDSALEDKIEIPYSCKSGSCGRCVAKLLAGKIHMHRNYALNDEQLKRGYVLLCQSIPLNDEVEVEV
jgi:ferredoxin-NADP reductase